MKSHPKTFIAAVSIAGVMSLAYAAPDDEYAPVTHVMSHTTTTNDPQEVCHTEHEPTRIEHHWYGSDDVTYQDVEHCHTINHYSTHTDYTVTYLYHGRFYTAEMSHDPGDRVHIMVDVRPS